MLGQDLAALAPAAVHLRPYPHGSVDVCDPGQLDRALGDGAPDVVINASGFTQVDVAETQVDQAFAVNARAVGELASRCAQAGALLVHFSTDYVFDGTARRPYRENDPTGPLNVYGRSKLAGEDAMRGRDARFLLLRTSWLFGPAGRSFPRTMLERAQKRLPTKVVSDQRGRPTYTRDLAEATWSAVAKGLTGIWHVANAGEATWYDVARQVFDRAGAADVLEPCTSAEYVTPARRPRYSVLDTSKLAGAGITLPAWSDALDRFLAIVR
jgi:dTDP-4-dehydrorhamnose reductase